MYTHLCETNFVSDILVCCCRGELQELLQIVKPQHFLPVHGEYAFLCAHAQLAHDNGIHRTSVIKNGEMLGISPPRNGKSVGSTQGMQKLDSIPLNLFYNDGNKVESFATLIRSLLQLA